MRFLNMNLFLIILEFHFSDCKIKFTSSVYLCLQSTVLPFRFRTSHGVVLDPIWNMTKAEGMDSAVGHCGC